MDDVTGLPELPEGYYWNIERKVNGEHYSRTRYFLNIRRKVKILGLFTKVEEVFYEELRTYDLNPETIRLRAVETLEMWNKKRSKAEQIDNLLGDYPPKRLT